MIVSRVLSVVTTAAVLLSSNAAAAQPTTTTVEIPSWDKIVLKATYYSPGKPGPGVLLLHMCNSDRKAWAGLGQKLAARGLHALALDYRGYGESEGDRGQDPREEQVNRTVLWPRDIDAALAFLIAQSGVDKDRIGAAGGSCGVDQAIQLARRQAAVKTLVLLAGTTDDDGHAFIEASPWMPILGSAAADDGGAVDEMRWLVGFSAFPASRMLEYPRGGHGTEMFAVHADLEPAIVDWFDEHLTKHPVVRTPPGEGGPKGPSSAVAAALRMAGGATSLREQFRAAKAKGEVFRLPPEGVVNQRGYDLLQQGNSQEAIEVFLLNVDAHPLSANTYDSLSDAYLADGQKALAIEFAEKALRALPEDPNQGEAYQKAVRGSADGKLTKLRGAGPRA
jgi:dienelactone hydrolase